MGTHFVLFKSFEEIFKKIHGTYSLKIFSSYEILNMGLVRIFIYRNEVFGICCIKDLRINITVKETIKNVNS